MLNKELVLPNICVCCSVHTHAKARQIITQSYYATRDPNLPQSAAAVCHPPLCCLFPCSIDLLLGSIVSTLHAAFYNSSVSFSQQPLQLRARHSIYAIFYCAFEEGITCEEEIRRNCVLRKCNIFKELYLWSYACVRVQILQIQQINHHHIC